MAKRAKAASPAAMFMEIRSTLPAGSVLHLGDGRRLAAGESALVPVAVARMLIGRGQAK